MVCAWLYAGHITEPCLEPEARSSSEAGLPEQDGESAQRGLYMKSLALCHGAWILFILAGMWSNKGTCRPAIGEGAGACAFDEGCADVGRVGGLVDARAGTSHMRLGHAGATRVCHRLRGASRMASAAACCPWV